MYNCCFFWTLCMQLSGCWSAKSFCRCTLAQSIPFRHKSTCHLRCLRGVQLQHQGGPEMHAALIRSVSKWAILRPGLYCIWYELMLQPWLHVLHSLRCFHSETGPWCLQANSLFRLNTAISMLTVCMLRSDVVWSENGPSMLCALTNAESSSLAGFLSALQT